MKRARSKKHSFFSKKNTRPAGAHIDFEINEDDFKTVSDAADPAETPMPDGLVSEYEQYGEDAPEEAFAVPEDVLNESLTERDYTAEDVAADEFAVSEEDLNESLIERNYTAEDVAADEFAVSEEDFDDAIEDYEEYAEDEYEDVPDEEIPFSTEDYTTEDIDDDDPDIDTASVAPPQKHGKKTVTKKKSRGKKFVTAFVSIFLVLIVTSLALLGIDFSSSSGDDFLTPVDTATGKMNVLLLGVDKDGERSDSIMLVSYDFDTHAINLMSIPRDTKMYVTDRSVTRKITEVHGMHDSSGKMYGAAAVAESVSSLTGIPINYYLEFSFDALDNVMDILGPVTFDVPDIEGGGRGMNYDDDYQDLHIHLKPGVQELSGNQIQQFLRYRKSNYGTSDGSDTSRIGRQQELLKAIIDQKLNISFILKVPDIFKEIKSQLKTNFTLKDVIKYAGYLNDISSDNMTTYVLPGESKLSGAWYHVCDFEQTAEIVTTVFGYDVTADELTNEISLTGKKASGKTSTQKSESSSGGSSETNSSGKSNTSTKNDNDDDDDDNNSSTTTNKTNTSSSSSDSSSDSSFGTSSRNDTEDTDSSESSAPSADSGTSSESGSGGSTDTESDGDGIISLD